MSLLRPTAHRSFLKHACIAGAIVVLLAVLAAPAMAWRGGSAWRGAPKTNPAPSSTAPAPPATPASSGEGGEPGGCAAAPVSQPFAQFGDSAYYSLAPGGSFEEGSAGWSLSNAAIVSGNESYNVAGGSHSLAIQPKGEAVSAPFCVSVSRPTLRFFARQTSGSWAVLNVILRWTDASGTSHDTTLGALQTGTAWKPSPVLALGTTLPLWQAGETITAQLVLKPEPYGGGWAIDDVFIDPPRMR
jgi:hypothetical protein